MNDRIQELTDQAYEITQEAFSQDWDGTPLKVWNRKFQEVFALLLVRECIKLLPEDCQSPNGCHTSWVIKEHFGVEE